MVVGTRYAIDDPYERLMHETKEQLGYWDPLVSEYPVNPNGEWVTYYRPAKQQNADGSEYSINPDSFTVAALDTLLESDPWVYQSQYANNPIAAGASDFGGYKVHDCEVEWNDIQETYEIVKYSDANGYERIDFRDCDLVIAGDPSGGSTKASLSNSRASVAVVLTDYLGNRYLVDVESGFVLPTKFFDWLFQYKEKYGTKVRATFVEAQGGFKSFVSIIRKEEQMRGKYLNFLGIPALGEKETTIRNILQPVLDKGQLYVKKSIRSKLMEELRVFPSRRMDLLDALKIAIYRGIRPKSPEHQDDEDEYERKKVRKRIVSRITGY